MEKMICLELEQNFDFNKNGFTICSKCNSICDCNIVYKDICQYCIKSNFLFGRRFKIICFDMKPIIFDFFKKNLNKKSEIKFIKIEESLEILTEAFKYVWYSKSNMCWYFAVSESKFHKIIKKIQQIINRFYNENYPNQKYKGHTIIKNNLKNIKESNQVFIKISAPSYDSHPDSEVFFPPENLNRSIFLKNLRENLNFWKFD